MTVATLLYSAAFIGLLFNFILFQTSAWRLSTIAAGLGITPMALMAVAVHADRATSRRDRLRSPHWDLGPARITLGLVMQALTADGATFRGVVGRLPDRHGTGHRAFYPLLGAAASTSSRQGPLAGPPP